MISRLHIKNYKCLDNEDLEFRPLTVLTGTNSSGKSSVLQAVLLLARNCNPKNRERMYDLISEYQEFACQASLTLNNMEYNYRTASDFNSEADILRWEDSLYFLTANRIGPEKIAKMSSEYKVGDSGEFLFRTFARLGCMELDYINADDFSKWGLNIEDYPKTDKNITDNEYIDIDDKVNKMHILLLNLSKDMKILMDRDAINNNRSPEDEMSDTLDTLKSHLRFLYEKKQKSVFSLSSLVNIWMKYITEVGFSIDSIQLETGYAQVYFTHDGTDMISPYNLGSGMSYLAKVLILCFLAKPGDVVMIENPEIHLHPRAQSRLGELFAFMAGKGIQLVIETHCEHLLSSLRYQVYKNRLQPDDVILYYKADDKTPFEQLRINKNGRYMNREGKQCGFPKGFFDVSVRQLMEIG